MSRFIVKPGKSFTRDELDGLQDSWYKDELLERLEDPGSDYETDWLNYLLDTKTNDIVFRDGMQPEDAILDRDLRIFVDLLNQVSEE